MFSAISRYRRLSDVVTVDRDGRAQRSKGLRLLPRVEGRFLHTVQHGDRLDHLAFKYYEQSRNWWHIVDANPAFLSPLALLGDGPSVTIEAPIGWDGSSPPWSELLRALRSLVGVEAALLGTPEQAHPAREVVLGPVAFDIAPTLTADLDAAARTQLIPAGLEASLLAEGLSFSDDIRIERINVVTWRIDDLVDRSIFTFLHFPDETLLRVHRSAFRYDWILVATFNRLVHTAMELLEAAESLGFATAVVAEVRRVGKLIVIPPRPQ
jgi:hypothetical protein